MASNSPVDHEQIATSGECTSSADEDDGTIKLMQDDVDWSEADIKEFVKAVENTKKEMSILCCGPTGVGKSTLLNGLMGQDLDNDIDEGDQSRFGVGDEIYCCGTKYVSEKRFKRNGVKVTVWDTPGLEGKPDTDEAYLKEIKSKCANFDIFLYCIDSVSSRATELKSSLVKFTKMFGAKLWKHAVVVLTRANGIEGTMKDEVIYKKNIKGNNNINRAVKKMFKDKMNEWKNKVQKELKNLGVEERKVMKVPVLPAGIDKSNPLAGDRRWLENVYNKMIERMKFMSKIAYLQLMVDQPFSLSLKEKVGAGAFSTGVGVGSALTGVAVGATIGALLIGIPSFGAFAGVGFALGGLLGGGTGVGSAVVVAKAFRHFKKKKHSKKVKKMKSILEKHPTL